MTDATTRILEDCLRYWINTGLSGDTAKEMRRELAQHLEEAAADGRTAESVVGSDIARFAEEWANEYRPRSDRSTGQWVDIASGAFDARRTSRRTGWLYGLGAAALVAGVIVGSMFSTGGETVGMDEWRWFWTVLAVVAGVAEIFTAGFFLLPISIGAIGAAIIAWAGIDPAAQWLVFFGVTAIAFGYLRRFAQRQDIFQPRVGANRWVGARGIVVEAIEPDRSRGLVRVDGEEWRATSDGGEIPKGARVTVKEVTGSKMVVVQIEQS